MTRMTFYPSQSDSGISPSKDFKIQKFFVFKSVADGLNQLLSRTSCTEFQSRNKNGFDRGHSEFGHEELTPEVSLTDELTDVHVCSVGDY